MDIGLGGKLDRAALREAFGKILPGLTVPIIEDVSELPESWDLWIMILVEGSDEFPTALTFEVPFLEEVDAELWYRDVARALSDELGVRSLFDGTPYGPYESPYWSLVWDDGVPFLADDSEWDADDDGYGPIHIVKPLGLELFPRRSPEELAACVDRSWTPQLDAEALVDELSPTRSEEDA